MTVKYKYTHQPW